MLWFYSLWQWNSFGLPKLFVVVVRSVADNVVGVDADVAAGKSVVVVATAVVAEWAEVGFRNVANVVECIFCMVVVVDCSIGIICVKVVLDDGKNVDDCVFWAIAVIIVVVSDELVCIFCEEEVVLSKGAGMLVGVLTELSVVAAVSIRLLCVGGEDVGLPDADGVAVWIFLLNFGNVLCWGTSVDEDTDVGRFSSACANCKHLKLPSVDFIGTHISLDAQGRSAQLPDNLFSEAFRVFQLLESGAVELDKYRKG